MVGVALSRADKEAIMENHLPLADELAAVFARMSGLLLSAETAGAALELITALARETVKGSSGAGITLLDEFGDRITTAATDPLVTLADRLQYELGEGPCLTAWERRTTEGQGPAFLARPPKKM
jgi:hypothetical protein